MMPNTARSVSRPPILRASEQRVIGAGREWVRAIWPCARMSVSQAPEPHETPRLDFGTPVRFCCGTLIEYF